MTLADVVVVGAGVVGASVAFHLARAGVKVALVDRGAGPGAGSTSRATGGFRAQFTTAIDVRLSLLARERLASFAEETGVDPGFVPVGYLWLASSDDELASLAAAQRVQHAEGLHEARLVSVDEARVINPFVSLDGVLGAAFSPTDGVLRPMEILRGYLEAAERLGVEASFGEEVLAIERESSGRITAVVTTKSRRATSLVVDAAGAWAASVARLAGVDMPVTPLRRQVALTEPTNALPSSMPLTIWLEDGFHLRVRDDRVLLLRPSPGDPRDPFSIDVASEWLDAIDALARRRVPALAGVALDRDRAWAGLYEMSPDGHALLGFAPGCENLLLANGNSGHGVMHAPALGLLAAEIAVHGAARSLDVHPLRPSRFVEGLAIPSAPLL